MRPQPGIWVISSSRPRAPGRMVTMRKAAEDTAARLAAEQAREAHEHPAEATAAHAAEAQRGAGQRAELVAGQAREAVTAARAEATAANARAESAGAEVERGRQDAEPERIRADPTWQREELRQVLNGRASVLEEARAELRARAGRAGRELDHVRAERAELGRA